MHCIDVPLQRDMQESAYTHTSIASQEPTDHDKPCNSIPITLLTGIHYTVTDWPCLCPHITIALHVRCMHGIAHYYIHPVAILGRFI